MSTTPETLIISDLNPASDNIFIEWLQEEDLLDAAHFITGVINDDCMVQLPENFTPRQILKPSDDHLRRPLHTYRYLLLEYVYVGEGLLGQRFGWQLTATDDEDVAQKYYARWEESLPDD